MPPMSHWAVLIGVIAFALPAACAHAQDYPNRSVTIVAPSAPGGMYSVLARLIGSNGRLQPALHHREPPGRQLCDRLGVGRARGADGYTS
jgi:hypothetical protein